ncbi:MAG: hypothetical protein JNK93_11495 [Planctomycetia bacterium]|nr:hypothetical protein [Planctomycetia bacterium]
MNTNYTATGTLVDGRTVTLHKSIPLAPGPVRVVVEELSTNNRRSFQEVIEEVWNDQRQRGVVPPSAEEVDRRICDERESWND